MFNEMRSHQSYIFQSFMLTQISSSAIQNNMSFLSCFEELVLSIGWQSQQRMFVIFGRFFLFLIWYFGFELDLGLLRYFSICLALLLVLVKWQILTVFFLIYLNLWTEFDGVHFRQKFEYFIISQIKINEYINPICILTSYKYIKFSQFSNYKLKYTF